LGGLLSFSTSATNASAGIAYALATSVQTSALPIISFHDGTLTISKAFTTTTLVSSLNPSTYGDLVTFTATVTANSPSTINPASKIGRASCRERTKLCSGVGIDTGKHDNSPATERRA